MIQFNLIPDVKMDYMKTRRTKRLVLLSSLGVAGVAFLVFIGLFITVNVLQAKHLSDLNKDIKVNEAKLKSIPDLSKILTIQNQLGSLSSLHQQKPAADRAIDYLSQLTPAQVTISDAKFDFGAHTLTITGSADALSTVNQYVDTLKFTTYTSTNGSKAQNAFSGVVLSSFAKGSPNSTYTINANFDAAIFDNAQTVTLTTPKIISTRSEVDKPADLFQQNTNSTQGNQ